MGIEFIVSRVPWDLASLARHILSPEWSDLDIRPFGLHVIRANTTIY